MPRRGRENRHHLLVLADFSFPSFPDYSFFICFGFRHSDFGFSVFQSPCSRPTHVPFSRAHTTVRLQSTSESSLKCRRFFPARSVFLVLFGLCLPHRQPPDSVPAACTRLKKMHPTVCVKIAGYSIRHRPTRCGGPESDLAHLADDPSCPAWKQLLSSGCASSP